MEFEDATNHFSVDGKRVAVTVNANIGDTDWASRGVDVVCCCTVSFCVLREKGWGQGGLVMSCMTVVVR